jgi:ribosomal-protein-serine acetyltransferase
LPKGVILKIETLSVTHGISVIPVRLTDAHALASLVAENAGHLQMFLPKVVGLGRVSAAEDHLQNMIDAGAQGELLEWHIFANERLCGAIRLNHIEHDNRKASVGYYLGQKYQGSGMATASVRAVLQFAFERLGFNRIELKCAVANVASQRVAERLGFAWEGLLRQAELVDGAYLDHFVYGLLRDDFAARAAEGMQHAA